MSLWGSRTLCVLLVTLCASSIAFWHAAGRRPIVKLAPEPEPPRFWPGNCTLPPPPPPGPPADPSAGNNATRAAAAAELLEASASFRIFMLAHRAALRAHWRHKLAHAAAQRGIVVAAGFPASLANAFVGLHHLRHSLGCSLPITIMYWGAQPSDLPSPATMAWMQAHIPGLTFLDASALPYPGWHACLAGPDGAGFRGWKVKALALYSAPYREVLYLDSDSMPLMDPEPLFASKAYVAHGSLFWPDIWCGEVPLFQVLGLPPARHQRQAESGQLLLNRQLHWPVLEWLLLLNSHDQQTYSLAYGDKDTWRTAFFLAGNLPSFYLAPLPPGLLLEARGGQAGQQDSSSDGGSGSGGGGGGGGGASDGRQQQEEQQQGQEDGRRRLAEEEQGRQQEQQAQGQGGGSGAGGSDESDGAGGRGQQQQQQPAELRFYISGLLQANPNGSALFLHRVSQQAKFDPGSDATRPITHVTVPSCAWFDAHGWHPEDPLPPGSVQPGVISPSPTGCPFNFHSLWNASVHCSHYDYSTANGSQPLPIFTIRPGTHLGRGVAAAEAAFRELRAAKREDGSLF